MKTTQVNQKDAHLKSHALDQALEKLRASEEKYRSLVENINDVIFSLDVQGNFTYISPVIERHSSYKVEEIIGKPFACFVHPDDLPELASSFQRTLSGAVEPFEFRVLTKEGAIFYARTSSRPVWEGGQLLGLTGIMADITEQKEAQDKIKNLNLELEERVRERTAQLESRNQELIESESRYRRLLHSVTNYVYTVQIQNGKALSTTHNLGCVAITGYTPAEYQEDPMLWYNMIHEADRELGMQIIQRLIAGENVPPLEHRIYHKDGSIRWIRHTLVSHFNDQGELITYDGLVEDITERKMSEKLREALYEIAQAAISAEKFDDFYSLIHSILGSLMPVDNFFIALYDPEKEMLSFPYYRDEFDAPPAPQKIGRGFTEYIIRTGRPALISEPLLGQLIARQEVAQVGTPAVDWLGVPLIINSRLIGVMAVQSYSEKIRFSEKELSLMGFVSTQVAMAIERKRAIESMRQRLDELTLLHAVSMVGSDAASEDALIENVTQIISERMYPDNFGIMLIDEENGLLRFHPSYRGITRDEHNITIPLGQGITGSVAASGQPWLVRDINIEPTFWQIAKEIQCEVCVPMKSGERLLGIVNAESRRAEAFTEADQRLLETIAGQLATALEKLRLFEETNRHLQRINALRTIDLAITSNMDLQVILNVLLTQTINLMGVDAADILLLNLNTQALEYRAGMGFRKAAYDRSVLGLGKGYAGQVALERQPIFLPQLNDRSSRVDPGQRLISEGFAAYFGVPIIAKGQVKGVLEVFHRTPLNPAQEWLSFLEAMAAQAAIAIDNISLFDAMQRSNQELMVAYDATLEGWSRALELRDRETEGHTRRVVELTIRLARSLGVSDNGLVHVRRGALLHDIGKMGIPDNILQKPGSLTEEEWTIMHEHPRYAYDMLNAIAYLRPALDIPYCHHEKWDGTGYPKKLKGEQIPLAARIFSVVDVWDALTSDRPYRKAWSQEEALKYIRAQSGAHFDPRIVERFLPMLGQ